MLNVAQTIQAVDLTQSGQTLIQTVTTDTRFILTALLIQLIDVTDLTVAPAVSIGVAATYDNWCGATSLTGLDTEGKVVNLVELTADSNHVVFNSDEEVFLNISTPATATILSADVHVFGYLI